MSKSATYNTISRCVLCGRWGLDHKRPYKLVQGVRWHDLLEVYKACDGMCSECSLYYAIIAETAIVHTCEECGKRFRYSPRKVETISTKAKRLEPRFPQSKYISARVSTYLLCGDESCLRAYGEWRTLDYTIASLQKQKTQLNKELKLLRSALKEA